MNNFISYPVGQGFFYSGTINRESQNEFQLVYDCGVDSKIKKDNKIKRLENLVDYYESEVNSNGVIDMLVISHFDNDHISGLLYLLSKFKVKKMYIPYYNNPEILYLIELLIHISGSYIENLILIPPADEEDDSQEPREENLVQFEDSDIPKDLRFEVFIGKNLFVDCRINWEFYFFNMPLTNNKKLSNSLSDLKASIDKLILDYGVTTIGNLIKKLSDTNTLKEIRDLIYKNTLEKSKILTKGDWSNNSSLCLYHRPKQERSILLPYYPIFCDYNEYYFRLHCRNQLARTGTLLTGDIDLTGNRLRVFSQWFDRNNLRENVGVIYLPHHGAIKNWDEYLKGVARENNSISVSSAGKNNSYGHPSSKIMMYYKRSGLIHIKCDEDNHFEYTIE